MSCLRIAGSHKSWSSISCTSGRADITEEHVPTASSALRSTEEQLSPKKLSGCFTLLTWTFTSCTRSRSVGCWPEAAACLDHLTFRANVSKKCGEMCFNKNRAARWKRRFLTVFWYWYFDACWWIFEAPMWPSVMFDRPASLMCQDC